MTTPSISSNSRPGWLTPKTMPYVLLAPVLLLFAVFKIFPVLASLWTSFTVNIDGVQVFAGFHNYIRLFQDQLFYTALLNTGLFVVMLVPTMLALAILLAVGFNSKFVKARGLLRLGYFLPIVMGLVAYGILFKTIFNTDHGVANFLLNTVGLPSVPWLGDPGWARVSLVIAMLWHYTGYNAVIYLAQLQSIPDELYEAAAVDGAGPFRRFWYVTLPGLRPAILLTTVLSTIGTLQLFDEPFVLTNGGPNNATLTIGMYLYQNAFRYFDFGYASAIGYVLVVAIAIISLVQFRLLRAQA